MDPTLVIVITVVIACLVVPMLLFMQQYTFADRQVQMRGLANQLGMEFMKSVPLSQLGSISTAKLLHQYDDGRVVHFMFGQTDQARIQIFDFEYTYWSGKYRRTSRQTVVSMTFAGLQLAPCHVYPESCLNFIAELLGDQDINFDDHPEFSRTFVVQSHFEEETRQMFDRTLMDFFCQDPELNFESTRTAFLLYRPGQVLSPAQIQGVMTDAYNMYQELGASQQRRPSNPAIQTIQARSVEGNQPTTF